MADEIRDTQHALEVLTTPTGAVRDTQHALEVLHVEINPPRDTQHALEALHLTLGAPVIILPTFETAYDERLVVRYDPPFDPEGPRDWLYTAEYRKVGDVAWTPLFQDRAGEDEFQLDVPGLAEGDYTLRLWAVEDGGTDETPIAAVTFAINHGWPGAPKILTPTPGAEHVPGTLPITWEHAVDPDGDPITERVEVRREDEENFTLLVEQSGAATPEFLWDTSAFGDVRYLIKITANDGKGDGPPAERWVGFTEENRPSSPAIRVAEVGPDTFCIQVAAYNHPYGVPWAETIMEIRPWEGSWDNLTRTVVVTDPEDMLWICTSGLGSGADFEVRVRFRDENGVLGEWSQELEVFLLKGANYESRWDTSVRWGPGFRARNELSSGFWKTSQPIGALVNTEVPEFGSVRGSVQVMIGGCECGWAWAKYWDAELRRSGFALVDGIRSRGDETGIVIYLRSGFISSVNVESGTTAGAEVGEITVGQGAARLGFVAKRDGNLIAEQQVPVGTLQVRTNSFEDSEALWNDWSWLTKRERPWYQIDFEIQRQILPVTQTTIRAKVSGPLIPLLPEGQWHLDVVVPGLLVCGQPGFCHGQEGTMPSHDSTAETWFRMLRWVALRDSGIPFTTNEDPHPEIPGDPEPACVVQPESSPEDPVLWPGEPEGFPITERISYLTDVIRARDDTEQRIQLRQRPTGALLYESKQLDARSVSQIQSLIWEHQPTRWAVPLWMDGAYLEQDLSSGALTIPAGAVEVEGRRFDEVDYIALWHDVHAYELVPATLEVDGSFTLDAAPDMDHPARRTKVFPVRIARMLSPRSIARLGPGAGSYPLEFRLETLPAPTAVINPTQYQGLDLLDDVWPNRADGEDGELRRSMKLLDGGTGAMGIDDAAGTPVQDRTWRWTIEGRERIAEFRAWLDRRKGAGVPFWAPTWVRDLTAVQAAPGTELVVASIGYADRLFQHAARRHLALVTPDRVVHPRLVTAAVDNLDGTETLTLSSGIPGGFPATGGMICFLPLYRLADDAAELSWIRRDTVDVVTRFTELPREAEEYLP